MKYSARPYILAETNWEVVRDTDYQVAILPWGATEAHNYHLPYATDNIQNEYIAELAAQKAWDQGAKVILLPNLPFGINTGQLDIKLCMNLNPSTQFAILKDLVDVVYRAGIRKLIIFNGHGGNNFKTMIRELSFHFPEVFVCAMDWYKSAGDWTDYFEDGGDHAGEMETSVMMHIVPEWVRPLEEAGDGHAKKYKPTALKEGWAYSQRKWTAVTQDTGVGNPYKSTVEKGKRYLDDCVQNIAQFFVEMAAVDVEDMYE